MPSIINIGTALPEFRYTLEDVKSVGHQWLSESPDLHSRFNRFLSSSKTNERNFIVPPTEIMQLKGIQNRAALFEEHGTGLGCTSLLRSLEGTSQNVKSINAIVFTSCSCPAIPSIDAEIIQRTGISSSVTRVPIFQHGCAGGVVGLSLGSKLSSLHGIVSVTSVELCSLVFQPDNPTAAQLVGSAIFADGSASALISPKENGMVFKATESFLIPNTRHLMGYDLLDNGLHLKLDRELPQKLASVAPEKVRNFLKENNLTEEDISYWLFHPGGVKILDFLETAFELKGEQTKWSREVLESTGNMSSATVLFVMKAFLDSKVAKNGDKILMLGIGPGLTLEMILFEWVT